MENGTTTTNSTPYIYKLTLGNFISEDKPGKLTLEQGVSIFLDDKEKDVSYDIILLNIKVNRKIYQPTEIEAELNIMQKITDGSEKSGAKTTAPSFEAVTALLLRRSVKLEYAQPNVADSLVAVSVDKACNHVGVRARGVSGKAHGCNGVAGHHFLTVQVK